MNTLTVVTPVRTVTYTVRGEMPRTVGTLPVVEGKVEFPNTSCWGAGGCVTHLREQGVLIAPPLTF